MKKLIVYASTTGNTEAMAKAVAQGAEENGDEVFLVTADSANAKEVLSCDVIYLGSPAMGDEVLEDSMEDFYTDIEASLNGKKVGLFGSYDWGDGQWMRDWASRLSDSGAVLLGGEGLIANLSPDEEALEKCRALGKLS